jgi:hypothetical protein
MRHLERASDSRKCSDRTWFTKNPHRNFRVRPSHETDSRSFCERPNPPSSCLTIVKRDRQRLIVVPMCERFGEPCNTDMYALARIAVMHDSCRRDRLLTDLNPLEERNGQTVH